MITDIDDLKRQGPAPREIWLTVASGRDGAETVTERPQQQTVSVSGTTVVERCPLGMTVMFISVWLNLQLDGVNRCNNYYSIDHMWISWMVSSNEQESIATALGCPDCPKRKRVYNYKYCTHCNQNVSKSTYYRPSWLLKRHAPHLQRALTMKLRLTFHRRLQMMIVHLICLALLAN